MTAEEQVLTALRTGPAGVVDLMERTGLSAKQVHGAIWLSRDRIRAAEPRDGMVRRYELVRDNGEQP